MTSIHQLLIGAAGGDAITGMALSLRDRLRRLGQSDVFALHLDRSAELDVRPMRDLPDGRPDDLLVYHSSFGEPAVTQLLLKRPERLVLIYHNVTPSSFFSEFDPGFAAGLDWGRHELKLLAGSTVLNIADSSFNANELMQLGFEDVHVLPVGVRPRRLCGLPDEMATVASVAADQPCGYVLSVSQLLPHKRHETVVEAMHILQQYHGSRLGLVVAGPYGSDRYATALDEFARSLEVRGAWFCGRVSDNSLASLFRRARVYVSASDHEGLGIPPLEAMSFGVPVVAREIGAIRETVDQAGLLLPPAAGPELFAEAIAAVCADGLLRDRLVLAGRVRVREVEQLGSPDQRFVPLITQLLA